MPINAPATVPNPGCKIPDLPEVPNVSDFLKTSLPQAAVARLIPTLESTKLADIATTIQEEVEAFETAVKKRARMLERLLDIPCPLPNVVAREFENVVEGAHDKLDLADGQVTLGESLFIKPGDDFPL